MSTLTTNFSLGKGVDSDNAEVYLTVTLPAALDVIDTQLRAVSGGFTVLTGNLTVTAGTAGIGGGPSATNNLLMTGTVSQNAALATTGTYQAAGGLAALLYLATTNLQAAVNSDFLHGILLAPTWLANGKSSLSAITARFTPGVAPAGFTGNYGVFIDAPSGASGSNIGLYNLGATKLTPSAFVTSDKYLVVDASGNVHVSALGPAS